MNRFLTAVVIFWYLCQNERAEVKCEFKRVKFSNLQLPICVNRTTTSSYFDRPIPVTCSQLHDLSTGIAKGAIKAENRLLNWNRCEISLRLEECIWPKNLVAYLQEFQNHFHVRITNLTFSTSNSSTNGSLIANHRLQRSMLAGLQDIYLLDLSGNRIESLDENSFTGLGQLREIHLSSNLITSLPKKVFDENSNLIILSLARNQIATLPSGLFNSMTKLTFLNLSYNALEIISSDLFAEKIHLCELHLQHNHIRIVNENAFNNLHDLNYVDLSHNHISFPYDLPCSDGQITPKLVSNILLVNMALFTNGPNVDLSYNHISGLYVSPVKDTCLPVDRCRKLKIRLNHNPIMCECRAYDLIQYFHNKSSAIVYRNVEIDSDTSCTEPDTNVTIPLSSVNSSTIYCNISQCDTCPPGCLCGFHHDTVTTTIKCNGLNFTSTPQKLRSSHQIELWMKNNSLQTLSPHIPYFYNITILSVSYNKIRELSQVEFLKFSSLQVLEMDHNELPYLNISTISQLTKCNLTRLTLGHNPWKCDDCRIEYLVHFLKNTKNVHDVNDVKCVETNTPLLLAKIALCNDVWSRMSTFLVLLVVIICFVVIPLAMLVGYKLKSKLLFPFLRPSNDLEMDEKVYDAFISYSHEDEYYVSELTRLLEQRPNPYKICLHSRNWLPGELIIKQIVNSIKCSRTTIIVMSIAYTKSDWCTAEFQLALTHMFMKKNHKVIVIWCSEEKPSDMELETEFKTYLKLCTYLKQDDENFLKRLESAIKKL